MKCQNLFSGKNQKNINLLSAELAQRVIKVKAPSKLCNRHNFIYFIFHIFFSFFYFSEKISFDILCEPSVWRKIKNKKIKLQNPICCSL